MLKCSYNIPDLPLDVDVETKPVLKAVSMAHRAIADLRREAAKVPNQGILIDTLILQEAQASSEIENIVTTQDEIFQIGPSASDKLEPHLKEVARYRDSLWRGNHGLSDSKGLITNNTITAIYQELKKTTGGYRATPGTTLTNDHTRDVVYVPPQALADIEHHMSGLEAFINQPEASDWDPLVKMALIHHQFESIHPFPDGNGRVGRILNVLYLVQQGVLDIPILYVSRYITQTKALYYELLQSVRDDNDWQSWILYMITAIEATARETTVLLQGINGLIADYKSRIKSNHPAIYSHELLNTLFRHPYTTIDYVITETGVGRQAASRRLDALVEEGLVAKQKRGRQNYYINAPLVALFFDRPLMVDPQSQAQ